MKDYLAEIGRYPLLSSEQEIQLSRQVRRMMELQIMAGEHSKTEQREIKCGLRARNTMMNSNLRMVVHIAKKYAARLKSNNMDLMDLIQEGCIGLHRAVELFDPTRGYKFSTYAYWWIRQAITRAIDSKERLIRIPQHSLDLAHKAIRLQCEYLQQTGLSMPMDLLSQRLDVDLDELRLILHRSAAHTSLDQLVHSSGSPLLELIQSEDPGIDNTLSSQYAERLQQAFASLDKKDRYIVAAYHGLNGPEQSQKKIAETLGITRSRVGQRRETAVRRMRLMLSQ